MKIAKYEAVLNYLYQKYQNFTENESVCIPKFIFTIREGRKVVQTLFSELSHNRHKTHCFRL